MLPCRNIRARWQEVWSKPPAGASGAEPQSGLCSMTDRAHAGRLHARLKLWPQPAPVSIRVHTQPSRARHCLCTQLAGQHATLTLISQSAGPLHPFAHLPSHQAAAAELHCTPPCTAKLSHTTLPSRSIASSGRRHLLCSCELSTRALHAAILGKLGAGRQAAAHHSRRWGVPQLRQQQRQRWGQQ